MATLKSLQSIVDDLADNFVSPSNVGLLQEVGANLDDGKGKFEIKLLSGDYNPKITGLYETNEALEQYRVWFLEEIKLRGIETAMISDVIIKLKVETKKKKSLFECVVDVNAGNGESYTAAGDTELWVDDLDD